MASCAASKLSPRVEALVRLIFDVNEINRAMLEMEIVAGPSSCLKRAGPEEDAAGPAVEVPPDGGVAGAERNPGHPRRTPSR